ADRRALRRAHQGSAKICRFTPVSLSPLRIEPGDDKEAAEVGQPLAVGDVVAGHIYALRAGLDIDSRLIGWEQTPVQRLLAGVSHRTMAIRDDFFGDPEVIRLEPV